MRWYGDIKEQAQFKSLTQNRSDMEKRSNENVRTIAEMQSSLKMAPLAGIDACSQFYVINGYVSYIKADERSTYLGCPD